MLLSYSFINQMQHFLMEFLIGPFFIVLQIITKWTL